MTHAVHRTILVVDVADFGDLRRTNTHQIAVRDGLYAVLEQAFSHASIPWDSCEHEDRGDGVLVIVPPTVTKILFVELLPPALVTALEAHNQEHRPEEQIRLRMAVHAGEIHYDDHGVVGRSVNLAFRLLDSQVFRDAMAGSVLAVITSSWFYDEVVWHSQVIGYRKVRVKAKETDAVAWIWLPGSDARPVPPPTPALRQLPTNIRLFVGREREIDRLMTLLEDASTVIITAIDGSAGIGKTALALHWAHKVKDRFPDGQLHVNLRGFGPGEPMDAGQALHDFLQSLGVAPQSIPTDLDAKAALYRSLLADKRILIVLDNARSADHVRPLLPGTSSCVVIITSRNRLESLAIREGAHRISLDVLSTEDAWAVLAARLQDDRLSTEPQAALDLVKLCAQLPLALSIVAARAADQPTQPLSGLVREVRDERNRLDILDRGEVDLSLRAVFSWSYTVLSLQAARLFRLLGVHPGPDIDLQASNALAGHPSRAALTELTSAHMVTEYISGRFRFHDLLRAYAVELGENDPDRSGAAERVLDHYLAGAQIADCIIQPCRDGVVRKTATSMTYAEAIAWFFVERATLMSAIAFAAQRGFASHAWRLAWAFTTFLRRSGRFNDRVTVNRTAVEAARRAGGRADKAIANRELARAVARFARFDEAFDCLRAAVEILESLADQAGLISVHLVYARTFELQGQYVEALAHAERAWDLAQDYESPLHEADALNALGRELCLLGRYSEALPPSERALAFYTTIGHDDGVAGALVNLGDIQRGFGRHVAAVTYYERALDLNRQLGDRFWEAIVIELLGDTYLAAGQHQRAREVYGQSLAILQEIHHADAERVRLKLEHRDQVNVTGTTPD